MPDTPKRPIELEDLFRLKAISEARFSPDGQFVVYGVARIEPEQDKQINNLWLYSLQTGATRQLTAGPNGENGAAWSPDSKQIAFLSTRGEGEKALPQVFIIPIDGGEARQVTHLKQVIGGSLAWSPDGRHIVFTAGPKMDTPPDPKKPYRVDRTVYRFDGMGYLDPLVQDIYILDVNRPDAEPKQLTNDRFSNGEPRWSPDSSRILFLPLADPASALPFCQVLKSVDLDGNISVLHQNWGNYDLADWLPDGKSILFTGQVNGRPIGSKNDLWVLHLDTGQLDCRTAGFKYGAGGTLRCDLPVSWFNPPRIHADGKTAFINVQIGGTLPIYAVALEGEPSCQELVGGERLISLLDAGREHLLYVTSDCHHPCDLCVSGLDGSAETRITAVNADLLTQMEMPRVEHLLYPGVDGAQVEGWALLPAEGEGPFPTVLYIHGGPHAAFGNVFNFDFSFLPARGYTVLLINHRASTGYGDEFSTAIIGDWGNLDYNDLMYGVDEAIARGFSDPDRLGCTGISGGGNLSCWIVGNTRRFKAAMPVNPVTDWLSFYGTSDIGIWFGVEELGGHPHEVPELYRKCSPVTYAHTCTTPTLMVQSENDYRCPAGQSEEFYSILKANGCVTELLRYPNSSHGGPISGPLAARKIHREALLDWMDRYLKS
ncbi:MAG: S9 family peptidase [Anaerolineaceae bacterium]